MAPQHETTGSDLSDIKNVYFHPNITHNDLCTIVSVILLAAMNLWKTSNNELGFIIVCSVSAF